MGSIGNGGTKTHDLRAVKARLESALHALSQADSNDEDVASGKRQALLGNLAGAMQDYLTELEGSVAESHVVYVMSPQFEQRLNVEQARAAVPANDN